MNILNHKELSLIGLRIANDILEQLGYLRFAASCHSGNPFLYKIPKAYDCFNTIGITWIRNNIYTITLYNIKYNFEMEYYILPKVYYNMWDGVLQLEECPDYLDE